jgi:GDP/UDP-N,N'-diacetylbacillosamine 2-epimerase (hydrolysing)
MKNICVVTGTRSEYGLLKRLMNEIKNSKEHNLILFVTGTHLENKYGLTYKYIEEDGFKIDEKIYMNLTDDSPQGILTSMSLEMKKLSECITNYNIDIFLILGDRYEMLVVAQVSLIFNIPIAHIGGGDITEGAFDNAIRNAITKLSKYHFTTCESSYNNILKMNENQNNVFLTGNPGLYDIVIFEPIEENIFYKKLNIIKKKKNLLVVYHSETLLTEEQNHINFDIIINSILTIKKFEDINIIFIHSNADSFNNYIFKKINEITNKYKNIYNFVSLKREIYLNLIYYCNLFIGNSSSGIYEAPLFKKITLNLGNRQKGRDYGDTVKHLKIDKPEIIKNIEYYIETVNAIENKNYPYKVINTNKFILDNI